MNSRRSKYNTSNKLKDLIANILFHLVQRLKPVLYITPILEEFNNVLESTGNNKKIIYLFKVDGNIGLVKLWSLILVEGIIPLIGCLTIYTKMVLIAT